MRVCYDFMWYGDTTKIIQGFLEIMRPMISIKNIKEQQQLSLSVERAAEFIKKIKITDLIWTILRWKPIFQNIIWYACLKRRWV
jgi:hypothetical protein